MTGMMTLDECCDLAAYSGSPSIVNIDRQKRQIGQSLVVGLDDAFLTPAIRTLILDYHIGNFVLKADLFTDAVQSASFVRNLQHLARSAGDPQPLFIAIEKEGGLVSQFRDRGHATRFPSPLNLAAGRSLSTTSSVGKAIGSELVSVGINWDFAPALNLLNDLTEPLDASRGFGDDVETVSNQTIAFGQALRACGVSLCATEVLEAAVRETYRVADDGELDDEVLESLDRGEHGTIRRLLTELPDLSLLLSTSCYKYADRARASKAIRTAIQTVLRGSLGFQGPVMSDGSEVPMETNVCIKHTPLHALLSGSDMVRLSDNHATQIASISALYAAASSSYLPATATAAAANRVTSLKSRSLSWSVALDPSASLPTLLTDHALLARSAYRASITALSPTPSPLLNLPATSMLLLLTPTVPSLHQNPQQPSDPFEPLGLVISRSHPRTRHVPYTLSTGLTSTHKVFLQRASAVVLVLCNTSSALAEAQEEVIIRVQEVLRHREEGIRKVIIGAGDPRDLKPEQGLEGWWGVCCYEYSAGALEAVAEVVVGERVATGRLPVRLGR